MNNYLLDFTVIPILLVASIIAFIRGFVRELSSFITWLAAITVSYFLSPYLTKYLLKSISSETFASVVSGTIIFILTIIIFTVLLSKLFSNLSKKIPVPIDQSLGLIFGFTKYYLICSLIFGVFLSFYGRYFTNSDSNKLPNGKSKKVGPSWVVNSYSYPLMKFGSDFVSPVTEFILKDLDKNVKLPDVGDGVGSHNSTSSSSDSDYSDDLQKGYPSKEIEKMNRLINIISE